MPLVRIVQSRVARIAVGPSTARGKGNAGIVEAARSFLVKLELSPFGTADAAKFRMNLDSQTLELLAAFPSAARHWGIARKLLNIFLRDSFYTTYLRDAYDLKKAEELFEIPLDSFIAKALLNQVRPSKLEVWRGVKWVSPALNGEYQNAATHVAATQGFARVHLDALWWSVSRD